MIQLRKLFKNPEYSPNNNNNNNKRFEGLFIVIAIVSHSPKILLRLSNLLTKLPLVKILEFHHILIQSRQK